VKEPPAGQRTRTSPRAALDPKKMYELVVETSCGSFTIRLDPTQSPHAAASVVALARSKYFDRTVITAIVPGLMIEAGDPSATGVGGPGYRTVDPSPRHAQYPHGTVAMVRPAGSPPGTAGSRFLIVTAPNIRRLRNDAVVGEVADGLDVVDLIGTFGIEDNLSNEVSHINGLPSKVIEIERVSVRIS
jgi:peptidyl-prolyl cis-trans isomerase B (cyclophilin B)